MDGPLQLLLCSDWDSTSLIIAELTESRKKIWQKPRHVGRHATTSGSLQQPKLGLKKATEISAQCSVVIEYQGTKLPICCNPIVSEFKLRMDTEVQLESSINSGWKISHVVQTPEILQTSMHRTQDSQWDLQRRFMQKVKGPLPNPSDREWKCFLEDEWILAKQDKHNSPVY